MARTSRVNAIAFIPGMTSKIASQASNKNLTAFFDLPVVPMCRSRSLLIAKANQLHFYVHLIRREGRCARHDTRGGMRWTRKLRLTSAADADGKVVWS